MSYLDLKKFDCVLVLGNGNIGIESFFDNDISIRFYTKNKRWKNKRWKNDCNYFDLSREDAETLLNKLINGETAYVGIVYYKMDVLINDVAPLFHKQ